MSRAARFISTVLTTAGLVVLADVGLTLAWQEPLSAAVGHFKQGKVREQTQQITERYRRENPPPPRDRQDAMSEEEVAEMAARKAERFRSDYMRYGAGIGEISIPAIGVRAGILEGIDSGTLTRGPGHYPDTELPGQGKTAAIAGHRTTYGAHFRNIDRLQVGDEITLEMPYGHFTYEVTEQRIVWPSEYTVTQDLNYERLVLSACHPLYSAAQRIIVFGRLAEIDLWPQEAEGEKRKGAGKRRGRPAGEDEGGLPAPPLVLGGMAGLAACLLSLALWARRRSPDDEA